MSTEYEKVIEEEGNRRHATRGRKHAPEKVSEHKERVTEARSFKDKTEGYTKCEQVLAALNNNRYAANFYDLIKVAGYTNAIKDPVDLKILRERLEGGVYTTTGKFVNDGRKIWDDMISVFQPGSDQYKMSTEMKKYFEQLVRGMPNMPLFVEQVPVEKPPSKNIPKTGIGQRKKISEKPMSNNEKALLKRSIMQLPQEKLQGIIEIISNSVDTSKNNETLEFDIDKLPVGVARKLEEYVKEHLPNAKKTSKRAGQGTKKSNVK
jgi:hypothetical protein